MKELIIWGGTGNFKVLCEMLANRYHITGYFDNDPDRWVTYRGIPCLGGEGEYHTWVARLPKRDRPSFIVSIGPGHGPARLSMHEMLVGDGLEPIRAVHEMAYVSPTAELGPGTMVCAGAVVGVDTRTGKGCIINTRASIDHECVIEDGATIGPGATLAGLVRVGAHADVYTGAVILPRVTIGEGAVVGAGAVVRHSVPPHVTVVGNPARTLREFAKHSRS